MSDNIDIYEEVTLPLIPLRGIVGFPGVQLNLEIMRTSSLHAFTSAATTYNAKAILVTQKDISVESPTAEDLYKVGVIAEIKHVVKNPHGHLSVVFEGISRIKIIVRKIDPASFMIITNSREVVGKGFKND